MGTKRRNRAAKMTNKRGKKVLKAKTQEDLELAYHVNVVAFPSEGPMPMPAAGSELEHNWSSTHHRGGSYPDLLDASKEAARERRRNYLLSLDQELDDEIPDFLKESAVKKPPENVQEHKVPDNDPLANIKTRPVQLFKDNTLDYPLLGLSIFVQPDPDVQNDEARFAKMFARSYCKRAKSVLEADLVIFGGGSDVNPALYGEERHEMTYFDSKRDETDIALYNMCLEHGIPMMGICRGAQFGSVMNKGKLYQDVDKHYGDHPLWDLKQGKHLEKISSVHHQMVVQNVANGMEIIATSARSTKRHSMMGKNVVTDFGNNADIEAFFYRDSCFLGVQGHPEYEGYYYYTVWCLGLVQRYIYENPDFDWIDGNLRMRPDLLLERAALANLPKIELPLVGKEVKQCAVS